MKKSQLITSILIVHVFGSLTVKTVIGMPTPKLENYGRNRYLKTR